MTQKDTRTLSNQILPENVINFIGESIADTLLSEFNNTDQEILFEESIIAYAKAVSRNDTEYFNRSNKELIFRMGDENTLIHVFITVKNYNYDTGRKIIINSRS